MHPPADQPKRLGAVVGGSLSRGLEVKLDPGVTVEDLAVGSFVTIDAAPTGASGKRFFGIVNDVSLASADPRLPAIVDSADPFVAQVLSGASVYAVLHVGVQLVIGGSAEAILEGPQPAKTIPAHFAAVCAASEEDVARVFGSEDERHLWVGNPLDMETNVCLNLEEFVKRSNGVFGKSGTGKTFLGRILLAGLAQKRTAATLVFDMHSEYGWSARTEDPRLPEIKGLKQLFPARVAVFTLDPESSRRRKVSTDYEVSISYGDIEPEDLFLLRDTLHLTDAAAQAPLRLARHFGPRHWLAKFLSLDASEDFVTLAQAIGEHPATLESLRRRLEPLRKLKFLGPEAKGDSVAEILGYLDQGKHVVLEFGRYGDDLAAYILVANLLTRRIHARYMERSEEALGEGRAKPTPLVIVIEEAHKFLAPGIGGQTIFGVIAREMRKYNVTLLVIDQRPSGIDEEVLSQIGTKLVCLLDNERDVDAVLTGVSGARELRTVLARLESKQQALIFGHAVPMPVVVRTRDYGTPQSYESFSDRHARGPRKPSGDGKARPSPDDDIEKLFGR